ncbi:hypothetical protein [Dokdonella sp.]|uniref:hypothetical protein n=1 Tax=Dokdonella sp. TaxID=2291710 RepID=UPI001B1E263B|nr:hypothetical protein [Dokdonella sp.]MBO9664040.1 hypothetical protein [Dokdonella sp.]
MNVLVSLIPAAVSLLLYALYTKASAFLLRRSRVRWAHSFVFAFLLMLMSIGMSTGSRVLASSVPAFVVSALDIVLGVLLGGWFFRARAADANGVALGWSGAIKLSALTFVLLAATGMVIIYVVQSMRVVPG